MAVYKAVGEGGGKLATERGGFTELEVFAGVEGAEDRMGWMPQHPASAAAGEGEFT